MIIATLALMLIPWLVIILPGIFFARFDDTPFLAVAKIVAAGISLAIIFFSLIVSLHLPLGLTSAVVGLGLLGWWCWRAGQFFNEKTRPFLYVFILLLFIFGLFCLPYFYFHNGLPSGDAQKAIFWGQRILEQGGWPSYSSSVKHFNRDPVDFYTPGLHTLVAAILRFSDNSVSSIGFLGIAVSLGTAIVAGAIGSLLLPERRWLSGLLPFFFVITHERFLRYIREPGYHLQNTVGELLFFSLILMALLLLQRWRSLDALLLVIVGVALGLSHQFSSFLAVFAVASLVICFIVSRPYFFGRVLKVHRAKSLFLIVSVLVVLLAALYSSLGDKIPHLFNRSPHLLAQIPAVLKYINLIQAPYLFGGLAGWYLLLLHHYRANLKKAVAWGFVSSSIILLLLSWGPHVGIDIPPVRTLFYSIVPLSVGLTALVIFLSMTVNRSVTALFLIILGSSMAWHVGSAFALSHTVRTNSTLLPGQVELIETLVKNKTPGGVLIDDYNRRSASWLLLAGRPTFSRLAADINQQMKEARQSPVRYRLYLAQLDFEKIYNAGSLPQITTLLQKYDLTWLVGIEGSSAEAFRMNPALQPVYTVGDITLFTTLESPRSADKALDPAWFARSSTIVNDIGDMEDTWEHLPVSLATTRLSVPQSVGGVTIRQSSAPVIPIRFNVRDFMAALWDADHNQIPDSALEMVLIAPQVPAGTTLRSTTGAIFPISSGSNTIRLEADQLVFDTDGFITLFLDNPPAGTVVIDVIALGLAHIP